MAFLPSAITALFEPYFGKLLPRSSPQRKTLANARDGLQVLSRTATARVLLLSWGSSFWLHRSFVCGL